MSVGDISARPIEYPFWKKKQYLGDSIQNPNIVDRSNFRHVNIVPYMMSKRVKKVENRLSSFSSVDPARQKSF